MLKCCLTMELLLLNHSDMHSAVLRRNSGGAMVVSGEGYMGGGRLKSMHQAPPASTSIQHLCPIMEAACVSLYHQVKGMLLYGRWWLGGNCLNVIVSAVSHAPLLLI